MRVVVWLAVCMAFMATLAHAEDDMAAMISQYRREHGLSAVKTDPQLTAIAERQAQAMAATGIMDHSVAGSFSSRIAGARTGAAAENIAVGSKSWAETFRMWQKSPGHNANLLQSEADSVGVAVVRNEQTRWKTYWAMVIADKSPKKKGRKVTADAAAGGGQRQHRDFREPAHRAEEHRLQDFLLTRMATGRCFSAPAGPHEKTSLGPAHVAGNFFDRSDLQGMWLLPSNATRVGTAVATPLSPDHDAAFIGTA